MVTNFSVEITLFLTIFTSMMYQIIIQNFYLEKVCRVDIGHNKSVCDAMTRRNSSEYSESKEAQVQKLVTQMLAIRTTIQGFFPPCFLIFIGSWSDRNQRRKPVILSPIIGEIICCIFLVLNSIFFDEWTVIFTALGDSLPLALSGGWPCLFLGVYSYVGSKCRQENRTVRMGTVTVIQMTAGVLGIAVSVPIFQAVGFTYFYLICICLLFTAFTIGTFGVKEKPNTKSDKTFFKDLFNLDYFLNTFRICFSSGVNNRKLKVIIFMLLGCAIGGPIQGEMNVTYMYTRFKFGWGETQFSLFYTVIFTIYICGALIALIFFSKILQMEDSLLGIISLVGSFISSLVFAFAESGKFFYLGAFCDMFAFSGHIAVRSLLSKVVQPHELAQSNAVYGVLESCMPMVFGTLYTMIYKHTIEIFPGTYFIVSAVSKCFALYLFTWLYKRTLECKQTLELRGEGTQIYSMVSSQVEVSSK